jgi:hypothetical protein
MLLAAFIIPIMACGSTPAAPIPGIAPGPPMAAPPPAVAPVSCAAAGNANMHITAVLSKILLVVIFLSSLLQACTGTPPNEAAILPSFQVDVTAGSICRNAA